MHIKPDVNCIFLYRGAPCKSPLVGVLPVNRVRSGDSLTEPHLITYLERGDRSHLVSVDMKPIKAATALATASVIKFNLFKLRQWQKICVFNCQVRPAFEALLNFPTAEEVTLLFGDLLLLYFL